MAVTRTELADFLKMTSQARGSVADFTVSANAHGTFIRDRVVPFDTQTLSQTFRRIQFRVAAQHYRDTLTDAQRASWRRYAQNVPLVDNLGRRKFLTGQQHFMRTNIIRRRGNIPWKDTASPINRLVAYSTVFRKYPAQLPPVISLSWNVDDEYAQTAGSLIWIFVNFQQPPTVHTFVPPWAYVGFIAAIASPPITRVIPYRSTSGWRIWSKILIQHADGRLSTPQIASDLVRPP